MIYFFFLETGPTYNYSVSSVVVCVQSANCIDTVFQNCGGHLQALKT